MCGIAGLFLPAQATVREANLEAMLAAMRHRGPDGTGRFVSHDRRYQAGFARLAIIDLATGDQPLVEDGGRRVLMGNGEIYNYLELRTECPGYPWRTSGDMEVVLPLASRFGTGFVQRLNGMYGLALYERDPHRLTLVRDRLGIKPLYWAEAGGGILFASEIKALFASGLIAPVIDETAVSAYLGQGYVPAPATLFRGVNKLPPGCLLEVDAEGRTRLERYWRPAPAAVEPNADALIDLLRDSVRLQLRSDVPVAALLSGGLDSGLVVALAAELSDRPVNTFTVRFEGSPVDESPLAALVAERYGTSHTVVDLPAAEVARHLPRLAWHCDEPLNDAALLPNQLVSEALGRHYKVALNGTGGDELFAGYGRYFLRPIEDRYLTLPASPRRLVERTVGAVSPFAGWKLARAAKFEADPGGYLFDHTTYFPEPVRRLIGNRQIGPEPVQRRLVAEAAGPRQTRALIGDLGSYLPEDLLLLLDRTSMAAGVEGRVPFLDHRFVEAALAVRPEVRTAGNRQKALERAIAARFLPEALISAPKRGFASPVPAWMDSGLDRHCRRILTRPATLERGWWTREGIEALLADSHRHAFRLYSLLMLELTVRLHAEATLPEAPGEGLDAF
ncbi:MAG: asparagine synthase (glutamine-hydrolyzing) [Magnetospirillum sp. WYHS-4]